MKTVTAVELRQSLGKVVSRLEKGGEPVLLAKGKKPVAAIISLRDFQERFVEKAATQARQEIVYKMRALIRAAANPTPSVEILRKLRESGA